MNLYPSNNNKYIWNDLKSAAIIAQKAYNKDNKSREYFQNIEENLIIHSLINKKYNLAIHKKNKVVSYIKNDKTDAEFFSFTYYDTLVLAFTGTNSITDWRHNLNMELQKVFIGGKFVEVHKGFYEQYQSLKPNIMQTFKDYIKTTPTQELKVLIIAHSLGTIGKLSCIDIKEYFDATSIDCITFGAPKLGNQTLVDATNSCLVNNIRIVNDEDIIPSFPLYGYAHGGELIYFDDDTATYTDRTWKREMKNLSLVLVSWMPCLKIDVIKDHDIEEYIGELNKMVVT